MRTAEEPLRSDLDAAGFKFQMLGRIEELEKLEREKEEMLAELVPAMEERGYDAAELTGRHWAVRPGTTLRAYPDEPLRIRG